MASLYIGQFKGYGNSSAYGVFNVYFQYDASGITLSNMSIKLSKDVDGKYTTNAWYIDSITIGGTGYSYSPVSGTANYTKAGEGPTISISGTHASGSSVYVEVKMHRSGQSANAQTLSGTVTGLATAPTGLWCNITSTTETQVTISGGYTSDGGSGITSSGYQYKQAGGNWVGCGTTISNLSPETTYYFRYYAGNAVGTSYSGEPGTTTYNYPKPTAINDFTIGNNVSVNVSNPLGRTYDLELLQVNTNNLLASYHGNINGTITGFADSTSVAREYASIPNSKSGTYYVKVTYGSIVKTLGNKTYSIKDNGSELPNFNESNWGYVANLTELTNNNQCIINGYSEITFSIDTAATSSYGASISKYQFKWGSKSKYSNESYKVSAGNGNVLEVSAIDSRQLSKSTSKTLTSGGNYVPYTTPILDYSNSYTHRVDGISNETYLTLQGNLSVMKFGTNGVANDLHSVEYRVYNYSTNQWSGPYTIPVNEFNLSSSGYYSLNNYMIHANGQSGGFTVGTRYGIQIILKDAQGLLSTLTTNNILVTDGKIARDVYQDSNGDYHQGINGMGNDNYIEKIYGDENITGKLDVGGDVNITGKTYFGENGREDYAESGFDYDQHGNMKHKRSTTDDNFSIKDNAGNKALVVYPETGAVEIAKGKVFISDANSSHPSGQWNTPSGSCKIFRDGIGWKGGTNTSGNDSAWLKFYEGTSNSGDLEIATGDDANEPIYFRQYQGDSVIREFKLFAGSGWIFRYNGGAGLGEDGNLYMPWYGGFISEMYNDSIIKNTGNISSMQDSGTYIHCNRHSGGAKGINWWDSDIRLKGNIKDTNEKGLEVINKIEHKSFTKYKELDKKEVQDNYKIGYIANQLQEIDPQLVFGVEQGEKIEPVLNINQSVLIPYITKAIQELSEENESLKKRISELENKVGK